MHITSLLELLLARRKVLILFAQYFQIVYLLALILRLNLAFDGLHILRLCIVTTLIVLYILIAVIEDLGCRGIVIWTSSVLVQRHLQHASVIGVVIITATVAPLIRLLMMCQQSLLFYFCGLTAGLVFALVP